MSNRLSQNRPKNVSADTSRQAINTHVESLTPQIEQAVSANLLQQKEQSAGNSVTARQNTVLQMQQTSGNAAVRRFLAARNPTTQREPAPPAAAPPVAANGNTPAANTGTPTAASPDAAAKTFKTNWNVKYQEIPMGTAGALPKQRDPKSSALYVDSLIVRPDNAAAPLPTLKGVDVSPDGIAPLGTLDHPKDSGTVSANVRFGGIPGKKVSVVVVNEEKDGAKTVPGAGMPSTAETQKKIQAALDAKLPEVGSTTADLSSMQTQLQSTADSMLPPGDATHSYRVVVALSENVPAGAQTYALEGQNYNQITQDKTLLVKVVVPSIENVTTWNSEKGGEATSNNTAGVASETSTTVEKTVTDAEVTTTTESVKTSISTAITNAVEKFKQSVNTGTMSGEFTGSGEIGTELAAKLGLKLNAGLGGIESLFADLKGELTGEVSGKVNCKITATAKAAYQNSTAVTDSVKQTFNSSITSSVENFKQTVTSKSLTDQVRTALSKKTSVNAGTAVGDKTTTRSTSSGKTVTYKTGVPALRIEKGN